MAALVLAVSVLCGTVAGSYQNVQATGIVAGGAIVGTLEEILLSFGIFLLPSAMADQTQSSDWWYSEDGNAALKPYYDDLASEYEKERFKVINGGGGNPQPSPTPEPEQKPEIQPTPAPEVTPGEIPTFEELVAPALAGGAISWANGAWDTMAKAVGNLWDKIIGAGTVSDTYDYNKFDDSKFKGGSIDGYTHVGKWYFYQDISSSSVRLEYYRDLYAINGAVCAVMRSSNLTSYEILVVDSSYEMKFFNGFETLYRYPNYDKNKQDYTITTSSGMDIFIHDSNSGGMWSLNLPIYDLRDRAFSEYNTPAKLKEIIEGSSPKASFKENIWVYPDLQETYQNNGKLEYPQEAPQPLQYPSAENLADLAKKLNPEINPDYSPEIAPNYVQELIQKLQQNPSVNPDPNPNPNPDPGTNPQPTLKPNPTGTPEDPTPEEEASPYKADLREVFPFCIPFDLIHLLKVFEADAEAPVFEFPLDIELDNPWTGEKVVDYHHTFELDMSDYEPVIKILRIFQVVFFIIALMLITRQQMIKG